MTDLGIRTIRKAGVPAATMRDIATAIFRRKKLIALLFSGLLLAIVLCVVLTPRSYVSEMQIFLSREAITSVLDSGTSQLQVAALTPVTAEELNSEAELLRGHDLLGNIVVACELENQPDLRADKSFLPSHLFRRRPTSREIDLGRATRELEHRLDIEPLKGTSLIRVAYASPDPELGVRVLHAAGALLEDKHLALGQQSNAAVFFERETNRYRDELADAERQLADFDRAHAATALDARKQVAFQQLDQLETVLRRNQAMAYGSEQRAKVT